MNQKAVFADVELFNSRHQQIEQLVARVTEMARERSLLEREETNLFDIDMFLFVQLFLFPLLAVHKKFLFSAQTKNPPVLFVISPTTP